MIVTTPIVGLAVALAVIFSSVDLYGAPGGRLLAEGTALAALTFAAAIVWGFRRPLVLLWPGRYLCCLFILMLMSGLLIRFAVDNGISFYVFCFAAMTALYAVAIYNAVRFVIQAVFGR